MTAGLVDAEAIAVAWLRADADLTTLLGSADRIGTELPDGFDDPSPIMPGELPRLRLTRYAGGGPRDRATHRLDLARLQVDSYAEDKAEAFDAAALSHRRLLALAGQTVAPYGFVSAVETTLGLGWQPDPDTRLPRYLYTVEITAHRV